MSDNLSIGVMSSINFKKRYTACMTTWLKDFSNTFIFGGHDANLVDSKLIPIQNAGEDWKSCFLKQQLGLKIMYESNPNCDWYSIVGCDNILFKDKVIEELSKFDSNKDFFISQPNVIWSQSNLSIYSTDHNLTLKQVSNKDHFIAVAGGAGFFLSNSLMKKSYKIIDEFNQFWTEKSNGHYGCADVAISLMLKKYFDVDLTHCVFMLSQNPSHYENVQNFHYYTNYPLDIEKVLEEPLSLHYISPEEMSDIYNKYKKKVNK